MSHPHRLLHPQLDTLAAEWFSCAYLDPKVAEDISVLLIKVPDILRFK